MANVSFVPYYRRERRSVIINVFINRQTAKAISLGIKIEPSQWHEKDRKIINHPNALLLNQKIKKKVNDLEAEFTKAFLLGVTMTQQKAKRIAEGNIVTTDFYQWCTRWAEEKYINKDTKSQAFGELGKLKKFAPVLSFGDIDYQFLTRYKNYMKKTLGNADNTVWKSFKFLNTMCNDALKVDGILTRNPFKDFDRGRFRSPGKDGLYISECDQLEKLLTGPIPVQLKVVTAQFLFMCYSGLRISDAKRFNPQEHIIDDERLIIKTQKAGTTLNLKLYDRLSNILAVLKQFPGKMLSDQTFNEKLKVVQEAAGINRIPLTSHTGRHTFGCILAEMDIPIDLAQRMMAHEKRESTLVYYNLRQHKVDAAADKLNNI